jgi:hypothetical protein
MNRRYCLFSSASIDGQVTIRISARSTYIHDGTRRLRRGGCIVTRSTKEHVPDLIFLTLKKEFLNKIKVLTVFTAPNTRCGFLYNLQNSPYHIVIAIIDPTIN